MVQQQLGRLQLLGHAHDIGIDVDEHGAIGRQNEMAEEQFGLAVHTHGVIHETRRQHGLPVGDGAAEHQPVDPDKWASWPRRTLGQHGHVEVGRGKA